MVEHLFDLRLFRYAVASADRGSFRQAALALGVQQSSVSKGVRDLELRIGAPLFERSHSGVRATPEGERFLKEAALGFDHLRSAVEDVGAARRRGERRLVIAFSLPFFLLAERLERFVRGHAETEIEMIEATCKEALSLVRQRTAHIAFVTATSVEPELQRFSLGEEPLTVALPRSHRLSTAVEVRFDELLADPLTLSATGVGPALADHLCRESASTSVRQNIRLHRVGHFDLLCMVARGLGTTIVLGRPTGLPIGNVAFIPLRGRSAAMPTDAVWLEENQDPALKQFRALASIHEASYRKTSGSGDARGK